MAAMILHTMMLVILLQLFFINVVRSEYSSHVDNATDHSSQSNSGRSKRALFDSMPPHIKIQIEYSTGELVELLWIRRNQYLANKHLPVLMSTGYWDSNVMDNIGEFIVYGDLRKCSSVVYFQKMNAFFGYIGTSHFIVYLPFEYDESTKSYPRVVKAPYVIKRSDAPLHTLSLLPIMDIDENSLGSSSDELARVTKRPFHWNSDDSDEGPSVKHLRNNRDVDEEHYQDMISTNVSEIGIIRKRREKTSWKPYYLETLVFVTRGIAKTFQQSPDGDKYVEWIVRYCIIYFNAVEMIFKKILSANAHFHVNLAKIIIEDEEQPFNFITNEQYQFFDMVGKLREELGQSKHIYAPDSFDHIFVITSEPITDGSDVVPAATEYNPDLYGARSRDQFHTAVPITVISHTTDYADTAHEISRTFDMTIDPPIQGLEDYEQCTSIMQKRNSKCDNCLKWSAMSEQQFREFFSVNRDRCFLVNRPRSLRPPGPSKFLSPHLQCQCFGYDSYVMMADKRPKGYIQSKLCDKPLRCGKITEGGYHYENTVMPFDGSVCGNRRKVCWAGECVPIGLNHCIHQ